MHSGLERTGSDVSVSILAGVAGAMSSFSGRSVIGLYRLMVGMVVINHT